MLLLMIEIVIYNSATECGIGSEVKCNFHWRNDKQFV